MLKGDQRSGSKEITSKHLVVVQKKINRACSLARPITRDLMVIELSSLGSHNTEEKLHMILVMSKVVQITP